MTAAHDASVLFRNKGKVCIWWFSDFNFLLRWHLNIYILLSVSLSPCSKRSGRPSRRTREAGPRNTKSSSSRAATSEKKPQQDVKEEVPPSDFNFRGCMLQLQQSPGRPVSVNMCFLPFFLKTKSINRRFFSFMMHLMLSVSHDVCFLCRSFFHCNRGLFWGFFLFLFFVNKRNDDMMTSLVFILTLISIDSRSSVFIYCTEVCQLWVSRSSHEISHWL